MTAARPCRPRPAPPVLRAACLAGALSFAAAAAAEPDPAQASFDRGVAQMEAGHFAEACPAIEESYRLDPRPGTLFTLAECEAMRGRIATAVARYDEYLALYPRLTKEQKRKQEDREKVARKQRTALSRDVPVLTLVLPPDAPPSTVVERDGATVPAASLGAAIPVDPGEHVMTARAPGGTALELRVRIGKGEKKTVTLEAKAAPEPPPAPAEAPAPRPEVAPPPSAAPPVADRPDAGGGGQRAAAFVVGGLGVAGVVAGGVTGALALNKKGVVDDNCVGAACNRDGKAAADAMKTFGLVSTIGFGVGLAGLAAGVVLLVTQPPAAKPAAKGSARSWAVSAAPLGSTGGAIDVRGAF